ncbi:hypothetical protein [Vibrio harveyi]|uniref:hypothetical protein n=1 Tax=Vibrio harveyi group TaxID=717610 RepID=UPI00237FE798|nr:hypothetical protein [Vibrio harveyi]
MAGEGLFRDSGSSVMLGQYAPNQTPPPNQPTSTPETNNNISSGSRPTYDSPKSGLDSWTPNYITYSGGKNSYSDTMAAITRAEYEDFLKRFAPTEEKLIDLATSGELYKLQQSRNEDLASSNLERAQADAANSGAKYGLGDRRSDSQKNNLELTNALSLASMNNEGRQALGSLQRNLIAGASTSASQAKNKI